MLKKFCCIIIFVVGILSISFSQQEDCIFKLQEAEKLYTQGLIEDIPQLLEPCIKRGLSKEDKLQAFKLIILSYLFDDNQQEAEREILNYIKQYPEYEITPADQIEFVYLFESYNPVPVYSFGGSLGLNTSLISLLEPFDTENLDDYTGDYTPSGMGLQGGLFADRYLHKNWRFSVELFYSQNKFKYNDELNDFASITYIETHTAIQLPLTVTYSFQTEKKWNPYLRAGFGTSLLLDAKSTITRDYVETGSLQFTEIKGSDIDIKNNRESLHYWTILGGGVKYKIPHSYLFFDVRFNYGLNNCIKTQNRFDENEQELIFKYFFSHDDFKLNNLSFSLGWAYTFYKPQKRSGR
ncbi:hypothetical protein ES708_21775 [subsurface metagenome]